MKERIHIVWFKRDLRTHDHAPLHVANSRGKVLPLYVVETDYWQLPDASARHWRFIRQSLHELNTALSRLGQPLVKMHGDMLTVLATLHERFDIAGLYSHQETGNRWIRTRDYNVAQWCAQHGIEWQEFQPFGVVRRGQNQDGGVNLWEQFTQQECLPAPARLLPLQTRIPQSGLPDSLSTTLAQTENRHCQTGGRSEALKLLGSFLRERGQHYQHDMATPQAAINHGSRLGSHLAYGTLSLREVTHKVRTTSAQMEGDTDWQRSLRAFDARLRWHCQSIQQLENTPQIETDNVQAVFDGWREPDFNPAYFAAWRDGMTGFPLIDAAMRALRHCGWLSFRLRALLVSFAANQLWLHWQQPAWHLAQCFTDYEPGIHYLQVQMHAGTAALNTLRIYHPVRQSLELDPQGAFIRHWLPELADVPGQYLHEPWAMPYSMQQQAACVLGVDYPEPVIDPKATARQARAKFRELRRCHPELWAQVGGLGRKHTKQPSTSADTTQINLF